jgi:hypothetical protein
MVCCFQWAPTVSAADAPGMPIEAIMVWATNGEKPSDPKLKPLDPELTKKFTKTYKWKNYFEVDRKTNSVPVNVVKLVDMSKDCCLEIKNLGTNNRVEVTLIGKLKKVSKHIQSLPASETLILAGDDKDDNAWLIILRQAPAKK